MEAGKIGDEMSDTYTREEIVRELEWLRDSHGNLLETLTAIRNQVVNGRLCYFGDHTGYQTQFSSDQTVRWAATIFRAEKITAPTGGKS